MTPIILERILSNVSLFLLFLVTLIHWGKFVNVDNETLTFFGKKGMIIASLCVAIFLSTRWIFSQHFPLSNLYESSMFLSWNLTLIHLILVDKSRKSWTGAITAPCAMLAHGFATFCLPKAMKEPLLLIPALKSHWLIMHVTTMILSYAILLCGSLLTITLLVIVITKREGLLSLSVSIPDSRNYKEVMGNNTYSDESIEILRFINLRKWQLIKELDDWSHRMIGFGFPLLTAGILSGAVWANEAWGSYWNWDPKETWALITWLIFATYLHSRMIGIWQRERSAFIGCSGFFTIWICHLGVNLLGKGLHSYGWLI